MEKRVKIFRIILIFLCLLLIYMIISMIFKEKKINIIKTKSDNLVASYKSNFDQVDIYSFDNKTVINVYSESKFDRPNQHVIPFEGNITKENIKVDWKGIGGIDLEPGNSGVIAVNIKITQKDEVIFNDTIDLIEKFWEVLPEVLGKQNFK